MIVSKVGFHSVGSNRRGYLDCLQRIAAAGRQVALIKCRDDFGAIDEPLALWPDTVTIGAMSDWDDADYDVKGAYRRIVEAARKNPGIRYWEYFNERDGDYAQQADLYIALLPLLADVGIGLCLFNAASGTPQYPASDPAPYREVARAGAFARLHGYRALLGLHEYASGGGTIGRYKVMADYLAEKGALLPIAITEWGWETNDNGGKYLSWVKVADPIYIGDDRVLGCALWTLGGRGWGGSNYQNILRELGEHIATVAQGTLVVTPPDPPALEGRVTRLEQRVAALEALHG